MMNHCHLKKFSCMKKKILFIANWKMNLSAAQTYELLLGVMPAARRYDERVETAVAPSFPFLSDCVRSIQKKHASIGLCAQDCFWKQSGAYTGEVSPDMLGDMGCAYVLVGHSERRMYLKETDDMIQKKLVCILNTKKKIVPVLCIGETAEQKKAGESDTALKAQLDTALKGMVLKKNQRFVIAYEPVWAIGSGTPMTADEFGACVLHIRKIVQKLLGGAGKRHKILYGGSVTHQTAGSYIQVGGDGVLVGGASQRRDSCIELIQNLANT